MIAISHLSRSTRLHCLLAFLLCACGTDDVNSTSDATRAYLGVDRAVDRALNLGLDGFNAASSANIPDQTGPGDISGTLTVSGQVDQGTSDNKEMRLKTELTTYEDRLPGGDGPGVPTGIVYATDAAALPDLGMSLRSIPDGTITGTLAGTLHMSGDLTGDVTLALTFDGTLEPVPGMAGQIQRVVGSTHIVGTATSAYGTYTVDLTR